MALISNVSLANSAYRWITTLRKRDFFRLFLIYVFMRHVPRQVEAPAHYLTGRSVTRVQSEESRWFLRVLVQVFRYFIEEPVRTVAIAVEASVRNDFDVGVIKEKKEEGALEEKLEGLKPVIDLMQQMTEVAGQEIDRMEREEVKQTLEKIAQAACTILTSPELIEELKARAKSLELAKVDLQDSENFLREVNEKFRKKLERLEQLVKRCEELGTVFKRSGPLDRVKAPGAEVTQNGVVLIPIQPILRNFSRGAFTRSRGPDLLKTVPRPKTGNTETGCKCVAARIEQLSQIEKMMSFHAGEINRATAEIQPLLKQALGEDFAACQDPLKQMEKFISLMGMIERSEVFLNLDKEIEDLNQTIGETKMAAEEVDSKIEGIDKVIEQLEKLIEAKEATL